MHQELKSIQEAYVGMVVEYHATGTVGDQKFKIATDDAYDEDNVKKQNPHLSDKHVKALVAHTEADEFNDDQVATTTQHGLKVKSVSGGYFGDFSETKKKLLK
jgi:hypothetical protein